MADFDDDSTAPGDDNLSATERRELDRLRAEVATLRDGERPAAAVPAATAAGGRGPGWPAVVGGMLVGVVVGVLIGMPGGIRFARSEVLSWLKDWLGWW